MSDGAKTELGGDPDRRENEGGHMSAVCGRIVFCADARRPYKVILTRHAACELERSFATMREAEEFIKRNTPVPARALSTLYDRAAGES